MDGHVFFVGSFRIPDREPWEAAISRMADFVEANVPGLRLFHAYADAHGSGTVIYRHPDADSLDQHLAADAGLIEAGTAMVEVTGIQLLGSPRNETVARLRASGVPVSVQPHVAGFDR